MDMRIDPTGDHHLALGIDRALGAEPGKAAGEPDRHDLLALDADIGGLRPGRQYRGSPGDDDIEHVNLPMRGRAGEPPAIRRSSAMRRRKARGFPRAEYHGR